MLSSDSQCLIAILVFILVSLLVSIHISILVHVSILVSVLVLILGSFFPICLYAPLFASISIYSLLQ